MEDLDKERKSFLSEPDEEDAGDVLARKLSALAVEAEEERPALKSYGTFQSPVGIGAALAQMPALEAIPSAQGSLFKQKAEFGDFNDESAIDRFVELEKRVEKERHKKSFAAPASRFSATDEAYQLSDRVTNVVNEKARAATQGDQRVSGETYDGVLDIFTKKGREKLRNKKDRLNKAKHEESARIIDERLAARREKKKEAKTMEAMSPSERIRHESVRDLPPLRSLDAFEKKNQRIDEMRARAAAEQMRQKREKSRSVERFMKGLMPAERLLVEHVNEVVRHGPGVGLQSVESAFKASATRSSDLNYFGALALGTALGKIRADVEAVAPLKGEALKRATDGYHAQATTPMDTNTATLFADALDSYGIYVHKAAMSASTNSRAQAETAVQMGEHLADALLASASSSSSSASTNSWNANHPSVALTAVADRLFQSASRAAVPDRAYFNDRHKSFWATDMPREQWKSITLNHFI